jgi:hypothetical protein
MQAADQRWGFYSLAVAGGGVVLALAAGLVLPPVLAAFLLVASQFVALMIGVTARGALAGQVGLVASAALLCLGVLILLPFLFGPAPSTGPAEAGQVRSVGASGPADGGAADGDVPADGAAPDDPADATPPPPSGPRPAPGPRPNPRDPPPGELFPKVPFDKKP